MYSLNSFLEEICARIEKAIHKRVEFSDFLVDPQDFSSYVKIIVCGQVILKTNHVYINKFSLECSRQKIDFKTSFVEKVIKEYYEKNGPPDYYTQIIEAFTKIPVAHG